ncbi:MAG: DUF5683 domain-containing protein [Balneolaceae bacterium]|nr:DUF5683 domain-containing protein [Balneolaceae bacterium]
MMQNYLADSELMASRHHSYPRFRTNLEDSVRAKQVYPEPNSVLYKSMIIPGWGQVVNKQAWKVPIIYGLLGGLTWYTIDLTKRYHDYQAAFYNLNNDDLKFGRTPPELAGQNGESLKFTRDKLRNRRDLMYVVIGLAYALNIVDAYVYAHMRSFDVSDDLSLRTTMKPELLGEGHPGMTLSVALFKKEQAR